ncbi:MAG: carbohydrate kinase family protein [Candidatus Bathyarchaeia archaeon]
MSRFDVVGFGALNVDKLFKVNKIAKAEEESFVTSFEETCGGSAANTIVGLARLGCKVGFIGKVAGDREGNMLLKSFQQENVDTRGVIQTKEGRSGACMGFVDRKGKRALYVDPGVNDTISFEEIDLGYVGQAEFLHLTSFVGNKSFQTQKRLVEKLPESVKVSFDAGEIYAARGLASLEKIMAKTFVFMPNFHELRLLTGVVDYKKGAQMLLRKGVKIVAVKLGSKGCYVADSKETYHVEPFKVKPVDTTGAGDAFCAGFLYGLLKGKSLYECGRIGNFVASKVVEKKGARTGLARAEELKLLH